MLVQLGNAMVLSYDASLDRKVYNHEGRAHDVHEVVVKMKNEPQFHDVVVVMVRLRVVERASLGRLPPIF